MYGQFSLGASTKKYKNINANLTSTLMSKVVQEIKEKSSPTHAFTLVKKFRLEDVLFVPHLTCLK